MSTISLQGIIDMHVHSAPDIRERAYDDFELMEAGIQAGARAIVLKSHHGTTMNRAFLVNKHNDLVHKQTNNFTMIGSITLNYDIGGLNPVAVESALKMGAKVVWLPTTHAANHLQKYGKSGGIQCLENNRIVKPLEDIFSLMKEYDAVLGTGHLAPHEIEPIIKQAKEMGLRKIVVTHPEFWVVGVPKNDQIRYTRDYGVYLERCYAQPMGHGVYRSNLADNLAIIKAVGCEHVLISTDGGQVENPHWELALQEYLQYLVDHGITQQQLDIMTKAIPSMLLGL